MEDDKNANSNMRNFPEYNSDNYTVCKMIDRAKLSDRGERLIKMEVENLHLVSGAISNQKSSAVIELCKFYKSH